MKKTLFAISISLVFILLGCESRDDSPQTKPQSQANKSHDAHDGKRSGQPDTNGYVVDKQVASIQDIALHNKESHVSEAKNTVNSPSTDASGQVESGGSRSQRTIRDEAESTGREMDNFEEQMDRLQAAVEGLLED